MVRRDFILFVVLLSVLFITEAGAIPSVGDSGEASVLDVSQSSNVYVQFVSQSSQAIESENSRLAEIGAEFVKPSIGFSNSITPSHAGTKTLPAIPAAFFMVLAGFFCVSLVKDRKVWTAVLASLLYFGLASINAVPQLLPHHNIRKIEQSSSASSKTENNRQLENSFSRRCDVEGTRYTGLLHRLSSIPDGDSLSVNQGVQPIAAQGLVNKALAVLRRWYVPAETNNSFAFAIIQNLYYLELSPDCMAVKAGQRIYFSRAFAINYIPHGPPEIT